jgi:hypothetical protein
MNKSIYVLALSIIINLFFGYVLYRVYKSRNDNVNYVKYMLDQILPNKASQDEINSQKLITTELIDSLKIELDNISLQIKESKKTDITLEEALSILDIK